VIAHIKYQSTKPDAENSDWDIEWVETVLIERSLPDLRVLSQNTITDGTGVQWGASVHRDGDELLVYGAADEGDLKHLLLAKTSTARPGTDWLYRTAGGTWSPQPGDAARLLTGVSNEFSVVPLPGRDGGWLLITSDTRTPFRTWPIVAYHAEHPAGPWNGPQLVFDPPENNGTRYAYNPTLIPLEGTSFILAYNVNGMFEEVLQHARSASTDERGFTCPAGRPEPGSSALERPAPTGSPIRGPPNRPAVAVVDDVQSRTRRVRSGLCGSTACVGVAHVVGPRSPDIATFSAAAVFGRLPVEFVGQFMHGPRVLFGTALVRSDHCVQRNE
jgi:hypothetical protein